MSIPYVLPASMNREGRIQIPKTIRDELQWSSEDRFIISIQGNKVIIESVQVAEATDQE